MQPQLPAQPRLADGLELVAGAGELLQLRGCTPPLRLTGRMPQLLLPLLDGNHTLEAITGALTDWRPQEVLGAIWALAERGLLAEAGPARTQPPRPPDAPGQAAFYWAADSGPADRGERARQALHDAQLHLFGWGGLLAELLTALRQCGADGLTAEAWRPPSAVVAAPVAAQAAVPFPRADQLKQRLPGRSDLIVVALPRPAPALLAAVNLACLEQAVPFLPVVISGHEAVIGPTVLPGRSACYDCFKQRLKSNAAFPEDDAAYEAHLDRQTGGVTLPEWPPFTTAVAALAAMEAIRFITRFTPPITAGQVLFVDALTGSQRASRVWKLPRCPACMRARQAEWGGDPDEQRGAAQP
jgi:bacteriocin biosynthesis cyclodehydratase domain-containing protein